MLFRLFYGNTIKRNTYKFLYVVSRILISKDDKECTKIFPNYMSILLMNVNVKVLNKILVNGIQQYIKE